MLIDNFSGFSLQYLMFYQDKYLTELTEPKQIYNLTIYIKYIYKNKQIINEISPVESILFKVNGTDLFAERDWSYYNYLIPTQKFKTSVPTGYYSYTFALYPLENQPAGHLNFTHFQDIVIKIKSNELVLDNPYVANIIVKEYNILRIMSGFGSLAWI